MWKDFLAGEDDVIMTSIVKKVLRSSTRRQKRSVCKTPSNGSTAEEHGVLPPPQAPPSPDLTGLTPEEIAVLKEVMRRQEEFEYGELSRQK
ncbi:hypothetical protein DPMN_091840 [Dreissena polymorpha]|uniref:Uncharacterized protein n=3 Tax=Dreissena polymorpha TaxID=45954 RepID=A0A9D4L190_DREPO|nr:hypothetical protein DPMN_091840 [Dreissena polymorpha]